MRVLGVVCAYSCENKCNPLIPSKKITFKLQQVESESES